ncbi:MAG: hypothetical protein PVH40_03110 [Gemmatimonadales bacterium]|jgi:hypothetical protein
MRRIILAVIALVFVLAIDTSAQLPEPQKWENAEWYVVFGWQFQGATADSASNIWWDDLYPIAREAWPEMTCLRVLTGEMGVACFGPMEGGLEGMEWQTSPSDIRFLSMFMERHGEEGWAKFETFSDAATGMKFNIALKHTGGM